MTERNALEELANRLDDWIVSIATIACLGITEDSVRIVKDIRTAQRIIAELAKVEDTTLQTFDGRGFVTIPNCTTSMMAVSKCREIAEEGTKE